MKLISSNKRLVTTLLRLLKEHQDIRFAVAWASAGNEVFDLLKERTKQLKQGVIGTHFYQTHPDVLDTYQGESRVRFIMQPSGVFHPKLYLFQTGDDWEALIGSANLTNGALNSNSEAMLHFSGSGDASQQIRDEMSGLIDRYWRQAKSVSKSEANAYREVWTRKQPALRRLAGQYGQKHTTKSPTDSSVMAMGWRAYFNKVQLDETHGFEERCALLATIGQSFKDNESYASMSTPVRKTIAGLPNDENKHWGWFGSMKGAGYFHQAVKNNDAHLSKALAAIPLRGIVTQAQYKQYVDEFVAAFPNGRHGVGTASRLLAMKRPDQFVCLDARNQSALCANFGIPKTGMTYRRYWEEIIERILDAPWWNAGRPHSTKEAAVWDGRAAMLDAIFYEA